VLQGTYKAEHTHVSTRIRDISKLPPHEQVHAAREYRAELKRRPAFPDQHDPEHKQIRRELSHTYKSEMYEDGTPVSDGFSDKSSIINSQGEPTMEKNNDGQPDHRSFPVFLLTIWLSGFVARRRTFYLE